MVDHEVEYMWMLMSFLVHIFYVLRKLLPKLLADFKVRTDSGSAGFLYVKQDSNNEVDSDLVSSNGRREAGRSSKVGDEVANIDRRSIKAKKRPARIVVPEILTCSGFGKEKDVGEKEVEVEGRGYCLFIRKGKRHVMEDGYGAITDINGDSKQAFFGVFDGHGGRAAVDFVSEKLGKNIVNNLSDHLEGEDCVEIATKLGYLTTDKEFLNKGVSSGACAATVVLKDGQLHVANAGDCRVVISRNGVGTALTTDHRPGREDERIRIENLGGYVNCRNGVWRVQDSLAVSRAFGDSNLKEWIISEPATRKLSLTEECQFLIIASDGLWDKVTDQEGVDVISRKDHNLMKACKELVDLSCSRGSRDDISVLVVDLQRFKS